MEPMTVGSPQSPVNPTSPGAHGVPFLPAYLMGDPTPAANNSSNRLWSTSSASTSSPQKPGPGFNKSSIWSSPSVTHQGSPQLFQSPRPDMRSRDLMGKEKAGGPPVQGLIERITSPQANNSRVELDTSHMGAGTPYYQQPLFQTSGYSTPGATMTPGSTMLGRKTPPSPAQVDPFYTQGENLKPGDELDDTWVTIFGFPPAATSFILQQFSQYGNILKHVISPAGNWMHLRYQSKLQAKKALSKNGKIFGGSIMVGVAICIDKALMECADQDLDSSMMKASYLCSGTPTNHQVSAAGDMSLNSSRNTSIRPLTAAYRATASEHQVVPKTNTPQKSGNVVSKAMEYMFGW